MRTISSEGTGNPGKIYGNLSIFFFKTHSKLKRGSEVINLVSKYMFNICCVGSEMHQNNSFPLLITGLFGLGIFPLCSEMFL